MDRPSDKGQKQRKRKQPTPCPNPLFIQWLTEWKNEAAAKGLKSHHSYNKAIASLNKYPLPLSNGMEAKVLEGFGDKICQMLDKRLKEHVAEFGDDNITVCTQTSKNYEGGSFHSSIRTSNDGHSTIKPSMSKAPDNPDLPQATTTTNKQRSRSRAREYIPAYRSGAYAILITLHKQYTSKDSSKCWLSKSELQQQAQHLADKSFTKPEPDSHYTAWSSMSTLLSKQLVAKCSSPARYEITPCGCQLAERILASEASKQSQADSSTQPQVTNNSGSVVSQPQLQYWYVSSNGKRVYSRERCDRRAGDGWCLVLCKVADLLHSSIPHHIISDTQCRSIEYPRAVNGSTYAYIDPVHCADMCHPPPTTTVLTADQRDNTDRAAHDKPLTLNGALTNLLPASKAAPVIQPQEVAIEEQAVQNVRKDGFTLLPNTFDIILYVDVQETNGGIQNCRKDELIPELRKNGVQYEIRRLYVGDFLWVARERKQQQPGVLSLERGRELALDYIVERKRMDDLAGSICDGRFREQKFRLRQCGLAHPIYLVEDFGCIQNYQIPAQTLMQATVNTQVIDGFYVKRTRDLKESVAYLTVMTRYLQRLYASKRLVSCSRDDKQQPAASAGRCNVNNINNPVQTLMVFDEFNVSSIKTKVPSVYMLFCKQLLQVARMTTEKVVALTELYKTPQSLFQAYAACSTEKEKELLVSRIKYGKENANLGPALSKSLYHVYCCGDNALR